MLVRAGQILWHQAGEGLRPGIRIEGGVSPAEPGGKTESRVWKASRVGEEQVTTLGPGGQVKSGIEGLGKGGSC